MTVAAAVLAAGPESALADADGQPAVRRIVDAAWSGGALPVVVVSFDPDGWVTAALAGAPAVLEAPAAIESGPVGQIARGADASVTLVRETDAVLVWPARLCWVGPETVTTLIEAFGTRPGAVLEPTYRGEAGWPRLLPIALLDAFRSLPSDALPDDLFGLLRATGVPFEAIETGDPGVTIDGRTPRAELPPYDGPPEPVDAPEWGAAVADPPDDAPVPGPARLAAADPAS
jgi:CTP:molybdopterin cytidylyltransferase MocA